MGVERCMQNKENCGGDTGTNVEDEYGRLLTPMSLARLPVHPSASLWCRVHRRSVVAIHLLGHDEMPMGHELGAGPLAQKFLVFIGRCSAANVKMAQLKYIPWL